MKVEVFHRRQNGRRPVKDGPATNRTKLASGKHIRQNNKKAANK
jgi:hypothetical protein